MVLFLLEACDEQREEEVEEVTDPKSAVAGDIFYNNKQTTYGDSLHIRVLSWGDKVTGSYLVLVADSLNKNYIGDSFFRQGKLANIWVDDLDSDSLPEVGVVLEETNEMRYGRLGIHELSGDFTFKSAYFPPLSEALGADYGGGDSIYRKDDKTIVREFNLLGHLDSLSESSRKRRVFYVFENNLLNVSGSEEIVVKK